MVEGVDFGVVLEEGKEFNANNTVDEEGNKNDENNVDSFWENGKDGLEDLFGEWDMIKDYVKGRFTFEVA